MRVPAKVNLFLGVGALRPDGYHDLVTVFHAVDLVDDIVVSPAEGIEITVSGEGAEHVPADRRNLAWQAAELLATTLNRMPRVRIEIAKSIPVAGGMAGGSADAAAALIACDTLWQAATPRDTLAALAAQLGADVAFPLLGGSALGHGRGEFLTPIETTATLHWVFALAGHGISAAEAYHELDRQRAAGQAQPPATSLQQVMDALQRGDAIHLAEAMANDLQPAALALVPSLRRTLDAGLDLGAMAGLVSGSGPTCAFLARDVADAARLAAALAEAGVCRSTRVASGPAPGARVVT